MPSNTARKFLPPEKLDFLHRVLEEVCAELGITLDETEKRDHLARAILAYSDTSSDEDDIIRRAIEIARSQ